MVSAASLVAVGWKSSPNKPVGGCRSPLGVISAIAAEGSPASAVIEGRFFLPHTSVRIVHVLRDGIARSAARGSPADHIMSISRTVPKVGCGRVPVGAVYSCESAVEIHEDLELRFALPEAAVIDDCLQVRIIRIPSAVNSAVGEPGTRGESRFDGFRLDEELVEVLFEYCCISLVALVEKDWDSDSS